MEPRSLVAAGRAFASDFVLAAASAGDASGGGGGGETDETSTASLSAVVRAVAELRARVEALEAVSVA